MKGLQTIQLIQKLFTWKRCVFLCHNEVSMTICLKPGNLVLEGSRQHRKRRFSWYLHHLSLQPDLAKLAWDLNKNSRQHTKQPVAF